MCDSIKLMALLSYFIKTELVKNPYISPEILKQTFLVTHHLVENEFLEDIFPVVYSLEIKKYLLKCTTNNNLEEELIKDGKCMYKCPVQCIVLFYKKTINFKIYI